MAATSQPEFEFDLDIEPNPTPPPSIDPITLADHKAKVLASNTTEFVPTENRYVLFCGPGRVGKSNTIEVLKNPVFSPDSRSMFAGTKEVSLSTYALKNRTNQSVLQFSIGLVDCPGAFEVVAVGDAYKAKTNAEIGEILSDCLKREITYLNLVVLFIPVAMTLPKKYVKAIDLFVSMFSQQVPKATQDIDLEVAELKKAFDVEEDPRRKEDIERQIKDLESRRPVKLLLCLTFCDTVDDHILDTFERELKNNPFIAKYFKSGQHDLEIIRMGCADHFTRRTDFETYKYTLDRVKRWRLLFIKKIFEATHKPALIHTKIFSQRSNELAELLKICLTEIKQLQEEGASPTEYELVRNQHIVNMSILKKNFTLLSSTIEHQPIIDFFFGTLHSVRQSSIPIKKKKDLLCEWYYQDLDPSADNE